MDFFLVPNTPLLELLEGLRGNLQKSMQGQRSKKREILPGKNIPGKNHAGRSERESRDAAQNTSLFVVFVHVEPRPGGAGALPSRSNTF